MGDPEVRSALKTLASAPETQASKRSLVVSSQPVVLWVSIALTIAFVAFAAALPETAAALFSTALSALTKWFGWHLVLTVAVLLVFPLWLCVSPYGAVRLGRDDEKPAFSTFSWFAMLFSAGMGIGMLFYGVAEPILHYAHPPMGPRMQAVAATRAMGITFFHWGLHAWAIYVVLALGLAYSSFRLGHSLSIRSALRPLFGKRMDGGLGHLIDVVAVFATLFGLATSLGLGSAQIRAGLDHLLGTDLGMVGQVGIIGAVTALATASVVTGLDVGIRRLSELNMVLALVLLVFVFVAGPSLYLLNSFTDNLSFYLGTLVERTFLRSAPRQGEDWMASWTLFYWAWWIAWSPFVGTFIARVSRGRTIREVVLGCLLVPSVLVFVWFTVFGNSALAAEMFDGAELSKVVESDASLAIYALLERLPGAAFSIPLTVLIVATFFVTSSDSGSLVVDMITSGGHPEPPAWQRVFWALAEGLVAATLLWVGGLKALQAASISVALPFSLVLLMIPLSLWKALRREKIALARSQADTERIVK